MGFGVIAHYIINIYRLIRTVCPVWFWWCLRGCSAVHRWGLCCVAVLIASLWLVLCCRWVGCPSVCGLWWLSSRQNVGFCCRCLLSRCRFGSPLPFWGVLLPFLAVFGGGVVCLLVRCFSWQFGAFVGFVRCSPLLLACGGVPLPYFWRFLGVAITPSKFTEKNYYLGYVGESTGGVLHK